MEEILSLPVDEILSKAEPNRLIGRVCKKTGRQYYYCTSCGSWLIPSEYRGEYKLMGKHCAACRSRHPRSLRTGLSPRIRFKVLQRDNFTCQYCGRSAPKVELHVDHKIPISKGGLNDLTNLVTACAECNSGKSDLIYGEAASL